LAADCTCPAPTRGVALRHPLSCPAVVLDGQWVPPTAVEIEARAELPPSCEEVSEGDPRVPAAVQPKLRAARKAGWDCVLTYGEGMPSGGKVRVRSVALRATAPDRKRRVAMVWEGGSHAASFDIHGMTIHKITAAEAARRLTEGPDVSPLPATPGTAESRTDLDPDHDGWADRVRKANDQKSRGGGRRPDHVDPGL